MCKITYPVFLRANIIFALFLLSIIGCKKSSSGTDARIDSVYIQGTVVDNDGNPLNAHVHALLNGEYYFVNTTTDGKFTIAIAREDTTRTLVLINIEGTAYNYKYNDAVVAVTKGSYDIGNIPLGQLTGDGIDYTYEVPRGFQIIGWRPRWDFSIDSFTVKIEKGVTKIASAIDTSRVFPNISFSFSDTTIGGNEKPFASFFIIDSKNKTTYTGTDKQGTKWVNYTLTRYSSKKYDIIEGTFRGFMMANDGSYNYVSDGRFRLRLRRDSEIIK